MGLADNKHARHNPLRCLRLVLATQWRRLPGRSAGFIYDKPVSTTTMSMSSRMPPHSTGKMTIQLSTRLRRRAAATARRREGRSRSKQVELPI
jgi:hypothetical protein